MSDFSGPGLSKLGEGIQRFGASMLDLGNIFAEADIQTQVNKAEQLAQDRMLAFLDTIGKPGETDYATFLQRWNEEKAKIQDETSKILTQKKAQDKFGAWWVDANTQTTANVMNLARNRLAGQAEFSMQQRIDSEVALGNEENLPSLYQDAVASGIKSGEEASTELPGKVQQARYNKKSRELQLLGDYDEAILQTLDPSFGEANNLTPEQVNKLTQEMQFKQTSAKIVAEGRKQKEEEAAMKEFTDMVLNTSNILDISREDLVSYYDRVGEKNQTGVGNYIESYDSLVEYNKKEKIKYDQSTVYGRYATNMDMWQGTGKIPWDMYDVQKLLDTKQIETPEFNLLQTLYNRVTDEVKTGKRGPYADDPNRVAAFVRDVYNFQEDDSIRIPFLWKEYYAKGVSVNTFTKYLSDVEDFRSDWKDFLKINIYPYYTNAITLAESDTERLRLVMEQSTVIEAMKETFKQYNGDKPGDKEEWEKRKQSLMNPKVQEAAVKAIQEIIGPYSIYGGFLPKLLGRLSGKTTEAEKVEMMIDIQPEVFVSDLKSQNVRRENIDVIKKQQEDILKKAGITPTDAYFYPPGDYKTGKWYFYSGGKLPADVTEKGLILGESGYVIKYVPQGGGVVRKVYKRNPDTDEWDIEVKK